MASPRILLNGFQDPRSPTSGWVYTCDASGNGAWQAPAGGGSTQRTFAFFIS